jgi:FkbM family methyltransferase
VIALDVLRRITSHPLNSDARLSAVIRFLRWQIASRLMSGDLVYDWVNGSRFFVRAGETGLTGNIYSGLDEFSDMGFLLHVLRPGDLFIDVGANVGSYSILAGRAIGTSAYAFEPVPTTYRRLVENIRLNHLDDTVKCLNIAAGASHGTIRFTCDLDTENHAVAEGEVLENSIDIAVMPIDEVLRQKKPTLMKIDVEGYETLVLQGASATLESGSLHSVIMELNGSGARYNFQESKIIEVMLGYGFDTYTYEPLSRRLVSLGGKHLRAGNTIFVRDKDEVLERVAGASPIALLGRSF